MIGAVIGDIVGSVYEFHSIKTESFPLFSPKSTFTDDTVTTLGIANALLFRKKQKAKKFNDNQKRKIYIEALRQICRKYPHAGYGFKFEKWVFQEINRPYRSYGNGSAMRVSPIGFAFDDLDTVLKETKLSAEITHNHKEGIKGAQAVAASIFMAKKNKSKDFIKNFVEKRFKYNLSNSLNNIRKNYGYDISCQGSVPQAITAFLESGDFEDAIRKAISIGGDSDTIACITGGIAHAFYKKISHQIISKVNFYLDIGLKKNLQEFVKAFKVRY